MSAVRGDDGRSDGEMRGEEEQMSGVEGEGAMIRLTEHEKVLFEVLLGVEEHFQLNTVMRVAGGWVRDKLMGLNSHDIDIALDNMSGNAFAEKVNEYLLLKGMETHHIGLIQSNPDQSKHLETATVKVLGSWVDFVNLRSEAYTEHSRIPTKIEFGTPEQDANRRDLTINAMFYNINTGQVEDLTQRGLSDLRDKLIRTPLPPLQTFMDDPLRVLRAFRFGARLPGFTMDAGLLEAASTSQVCEALAKKIARERIGKELDGMLLAPRPELALSWIYENGLFPIVFQPPTTISNPIDMDSVSLAATTLVRRVIAVSRSISLEWSLEDRKMAVMAAALLPYANHTYLTPKKRIDTVANYIVLESLKHPKIEADEVGILHFGVTQFERLFQPDHVLAEGEPGIQNIPLDQQSVALGRVMRKVGNLWHTALILATLDHLPPFPLPLTSENFDAPLPLSHPILQTYLSIKEHIEVLGLHRVHLLKHFFSGDLLQPLLQLSPGPSMGLALELQMDWMLQHYQLIRMDPVLAQDNCKAYLLSPEFKASLELSSNALRSKGNNKGKK